MPDEHQNISRPSRRIVFSGLGALGVAVALAGCGSDNTGTTSPSSGDSASSDAGADGSPSAASSGGKALAKTTEIPVGGGMILADRKIVVTQPKAGEFKGFSAVCTHQGFIVTSVQDDVIKCNHHGSEYSAATGAVEQGPAPTSLKAVNVVVRDGSVFAA